MKGNICCCLQDIHTYVQSNTLMGRPKIKAQSHASHKHKKQNILINNNNNNNNKVFNLIFLIVLDEKKNINDYLK